MFLIFKKYFFARGSRQTYISIPNFENHTAHAMQTPTPIANSNSWRRIILISLFVLCTAYWTGYYIGKDRYDAEKMELRAQLNQLHQQLDSLQQAHQQLLDKKESKK